MKTLIEIHVLQNFAPSNLNRDDTGAPKDAFFGGTRRGRVSSQCDKRAVRQYFDEKVREGVFSADELAVRTKRVYQAIADALTGKRDPAEARAKAERALSYVKLKAADDGKSQYLLFLGRREIAALADTIDQHWDLIIEAEEAPAEDGAGKKKPKSKKDTAGSAPKEVKEQIEAVFNGGKAVDVALFGRMLADMPEKNQHAACQVAHAISTHAVEREFDFYTAVDDLKPEDTAGADMMGTVEFNSACYYRYAVVDWEKLVVNLQGDADLAAKGLRVFLQGFVLAEPTGKQNSFAAHNPPEFVAVSVCHDAAPRNLANAFETAIRAKTGESLTRKSAEALAAKAGVLDTAYPRNGKTFVLNVAQAEVGSLGENKASLDTVLDATLAAVED
ncbi:type I-E CRISPR-associated protein Cas7/Cse4/CasC [Acidithiobacillus sp. CV18-2]|nr:type I-E CRISPR-associated protein Cas7/Cse4/CasC [Acidithiobacillus sp. CV18-3]MBU2758325.1 type I-E CRISPR-associated protein Cas7/Cse4/CasC [Acidithiobacillus sp. BN09-2]MBU2775948.1 type I-E CRISPR-associated protein Cas7/Cse4/CasC [Acidithiobacillus sp. CV18-2]MBU2798844.1 type I-E CRISPR-associated protein Cas7/Cse4/CasC [Acidithiobacillus sp. VAN18-4]